MDSQVCEYSDYDVIKILIAAGAEIPDDDTTLPLAVEANDTKFISYILEEGITKNLKKLILFVALQLRNIEIMDIILKNDMSLITSHDRNNKNLLIRAIGYSFVGGVEYLLEMDTDNILFPTANHERSILLSTRDIRILSILIRANTKRVHAGYESIIVDDVLVTMIKENYPENCIRLILQAKPESITTYPYAIHKAIMRGSVRSVNVLLEFGYDINETNDNDLTPLMLAVKLSNENMVRFLLEKGAEPLISHKGESALGLAYKLNNQEIIDLITSKLE